MYVLELFYSSSCITLTLPNHRGRLMIEVLLFHTNEIVSHCNIKRTSFIQLNSHYFST